LPAASPKFALFAQCRTAKRFHMQPKRRVEVSSLKYFNECGVNGPTMWEPVIGECVQCNWPNCHAWLPGYSSSNYANEIGSQILGVFEEPIQAIAGLAAAKKQKRLLNRFAHYQIVKKEL
jgi:hypothetical protein